MSDPNELTRWDRIILEAGATCLYLEASLFDGRGYISAAGFLAAAQSFHIIESARLEAESETHITTLERWQALRLGKL